MLDGRGEGVGGTSTDEIALNRGWGGGVKQGKDEGQGVVLVQLQRC